MREQLSPQSYEARGLLQQEVLAKYYRDSDDPGETQPQIGKVRTDAPRLGAWSPLFFCDEKRRGRGPHRYAVQVAQAVPKTPSKGTPRASPQMFVGPPLSLPPGVLEAAMDAALDESVRSSPNRPPSAPPDCQNTPTPVPQLFPCVGLSLRSAGVPVARTTVHTPDQPSTAVSVTKRASSALEQRRQEVQSQPFKAGNPRPRLLERKFPSMDLSAISPPAASLRMASNPKTVLSDSSTPKAAASEVPEMLWNAASRGPGSPTSVTGVHGPSTDVMVAQLRALAFLTSGSDRAAVGSGTPSPRNSNPLRRPSLPTNSKSSRSKRGGETPHSPTATPHSAERSFQLPKKHTGTSPLWRIKHQDTKDERLMRLNACRKAKLKEPPDYHRDRIARRWELDLATESFQRYFQHKMGNETDLEALKEAMADFGLKAKNRGEKLDMQKVITQFEDNKTLGFGDYCTAVEEARAKLRSSHTSSVFQVWKQLDVEDVGGLSAQDLQQVLKALNLHPKTLQDRLSINQLMGELNPDSQGLYSFHEAEFLVAWAREHAESARRRQERELQKRFELEPDLFEDFRSSILILYEAFREADDDTDNHLDSEEALALLGEFGLTANKQHKQLAVETIARMRRSAEDLSETEEPIDFPLFLKVLREVRIMEAEQRRDDVQSLFCLYDFNGSGDLEIKEVCRILMDLELQPRNPQEQESISQLLEEVDKDGSGVLDLEELMHLTQLIVEKVVQLHRQAENERAEALGFTQHASRQLRRAFEALDVHSYGVLGLQEVETAVHLMGWRVPQVRLQRLMLEVDNGQSGRLDFSEFLWMMRTLEEEVQNHPAPTPSRGATPVSSPATVDDENPGHAPPANTTAPITQAQAAAPSRRVSAQDKDRHTSRASTVRSRSGSFGKAKMRLSFRLPEPGQEEG